MIKIRKLVLILIQYRVIRGPSPPFVCPRAATSSQGHAFRLQDSARPPPMEALLPAWADTPHHTAFQIFLLLRLGSSTPCQVVSPRAAPPLHARVLTSCSRLLFSQRASFPNLGSLCHSSLPPLPPPRPHHTHTYFALN